MNKSIETSVGRAPLKSVKKHTPNLRSRKPLSRKKIINYIKPIEPNTKGNTKPSHETGFTSSKKSNSI